MYSLLRLDYLLIDNIESEAFHLDSLSRTHMILSSYLVAVNHYGLVSYRSN